MNIESQIKVYEEQGLVLWQENGKLKFSYNSTSLPEELKSELLEKRQKLVTHFVQEQDRPIELSGLQEAYWLGEQKAFAQSSAAFLHLVYTGDIPHKHTLEEALITLCKRHPPLNYTLNANYPKFETCRDTSCDIVEIDLAKDIEIERCHSLKNVKELLPSIDSEKHLFRLILVKNSTSTSLHVLYRLVLFDAFSIHVFIDELIKIANNYPVENLTKVVYNHKSLYQLEIKRKLLRQKSMLYWEKKVLELPPAPTLPLSNNSNEKLSNRYFIEHKHCIKANQYQALKNHARNFGVSINSVLITAYLATLSKWSGGTPICASVMYSQRNDLPEDYSN
ncbi:MAG: condensation domain-containing protein, partial [Gammaproteobacteria bacterium]|nr:condensation domain-containing protein [Gammaproteobacteria bacterium]